MIIGAQLYTLREFCKTPESFADTLARVADIGYTCVQVSGTCAYEGEWLAAELKKNGLTCAVTHSPLAEMLESPAALAAKHLTFDCRRVGLGGIPKFDGSEKKFVDFIEDLKKIVPALKDVGVKFYFHNHAWDFCRGADGRRFLDRLCDLFPAEDLGIIYDTYWAQFAGLDPADYLEKNLAGRSDVIHFKDLTVVGKEQRFAPIGAGNINLDRVLAAAEKVGTEYILVEQDKTYETDPFACLAKSYNWFTARGLH